MSDEILVFIQADTDIVVARQRGRDLASHLGFRSTDQALIATAISELARNILSYAGSGEIVLSSAVRGRRRGIMVIASDRGPGISNVERAMQDGYSTANGLGLGLPGTRRLMDEFELSSKLGQGTTVIVKKWLS
jgi:serine/threonine-protein kinase RsbT